MNRISDEVIERIIDFYLGDISQREKMDLERWVKETPEQEQCFKQTLKMCQRLRLSSREERAGGDEDPDTGKMAGRKAETAETIRVRRGLVCGGGLTVGGHFPRVLHEPERTGAGDIA